jgi:hypothetical protein
LAAWRDDRAGPWVPRWGSARKCPAGRNPPSQGDSSSLAFLAGAAVAITAGTMVAYWVTGQLGRAAGPSGQGTVKVVIDWLVVALFLFLIVCTFLRRKDTKRPKWMGRLQHGLSGQLDLGREVGCRNGRAAGSEAVAPSGAFRAIDPSTA